MVVRGMEILPDDPERVRRQKIARITLDSMVQFVGLLDAQGTVLEINKVALDAVGITLGDVEGKPFWTTFWWQVSDEINRTLRESIARAARGEFVRWDTPIFGRAGGKETIIIDASLCPVKDDDGNVVFLCAEGRDITEKKAQEQLIAQQNDELSGLLQRIRELDEIKTQFFANVSHELRTPLALILGPAQRLIDDDGSLSLADRREAGQVVARNARMLLKHVNDLLDMSKLEAKKLTIELSVADVAALLRLLASHFAVLAADRRIELVVDAGEPCLAAVDPDKLQRVLMNLLGNAFKFVPAGGRVRCSLQTTPEEVRLAVDDSGPGVKPEDRQRVFERFRQGDGGINRKVGGTGLGLAIAKEFVELHRGRIEVLDSALGGARFVVSIPRNLSPNVPQSAERAGAAPLAAAAPNEPQSSEPQSSEPQASAPQSPEPTPLNRTLLDGVIDEIRAVHPTPAAAAAPLAPLAGRPRVLVVEDNADMNRFVGQCLSAQYDVISAFDGREGLEKALAHRPALIVSDIMMPNVSGVEMIAKLRELPELGAIPILLLSAKADEELMVRLLDEGARDFVVKPFSERDLLVRVRNILAADQAREQAELQRQQMSGLRDAAESAVRAKDEFLAMLGHELRNPLSPILTALQLMRLQGGASSERERVVIERQVNHLTRLVDDLLDVSRIARGRVELRLEPLEISEVVARALEMASPLIEERSHHVSVDIPRRGLLVDGDPTRLGQVISNLLTNAAKYTPPGGDIDVAAEASGDDVVLRVKDSGIGIAPDVLPRVFDLFVQEQQALDRSRGGLGLGLTIVKNLVERHGGSVTARSDGAGHGSEFIVRLPAARPSSSAAPSRAPSTPRRRALEPGLDALATSADAAPRASRVLIVDDNQDGAEMLAAALDALGYPTAVAHDAPAALRIAVDFLPDVALLDIGLPVMDGYELAAHLRAIPQLAHLHLIALTGYGQSEDRRRTREAGFHYHLVKPVDIASIEAAMKLRGSGGAR